VELNPLPADAAVKSLLIGQTADTFRARSIDMSISECSVAIIPCLNEGASIARLAREVLHFLPAVIVIDDGSTDNTAELAHRAGALVLQRAHSGGKGSALTLGFRHARELGYRWAVTLDGDGQHAAADIPAFLEAAERAGARMIVGNRMRKTQGMPWVRRWVNRWMSATLSDFCHQSWPDTQCGFRMIHLPTWASCRINAKNFEIESELLVRFAAAGHSIHFVPVQTRYAGEPSRIHPFRDTVRWLKWWRSTRAALGATNAAVWP
jgi:glycosyltransferase involved in cell wall biosynthesis